MSTKLFYKGFTGSAEVSIEDQCLFGKIEFIGDLITYEGNDFNELKSAFESAVDEYIETCKEIGKDPEKPFKGSLNVRFGPELHRKVALAAKERGISINEFIANAVENHITAKREIHIHHHEAEHAPQLATGPVPNFGPQSDLGCSRWQTNIALKN